MVEGPLLLPLRLHNLRGQGGSCKPARRGPQSASVGVRFLYKMKVVEFRLVLPLTPEVGPQPSKLSKRPESTSVHCRFSFYFLLLLLLLPVLLLLIPVLLQLPLLLLLV